MIEFSEINPEIRLRPCESCGEPVSNFSNWLLSYLVNTPIRLHTECRDFLIDGVKRRRGVRIYRLAAKVVKR